MDDSELQQILKQQEELWQKQSEDLLKGYVQQYQELSKQAINDMQTMIMKSQQQMQEARGAQEEPPPEIHMKWTQVNGQNVLVLSEKAGNEILKVFDILSKLLPELQKQVKGRRGLR